MNLNRYGGAKTLRALNFICHAPQAQSVGLVGDFNGWNPTSHPMKRMLPFLSLFHGTGAVLSANPAGGLLDAIEVERILGLGNGLLNLLHDLL
jgi:hypothetical protein